MPENVAGSETLGDGTKQGVTDFGSCGYGGPCPPGGTHRYFFKIYALDKMLEPGGKAGKKDLMNAMEGHILAEGRFMGRYKRNKNVY